MLNTVAVYSLVHYNDCILCLYAYVGADIVYQPLNQEYSEIIKLAHEIGGEGFKDLTAIEIQELIVDEELDEDDLIEMVNDEIHENSDSDEETEPASFTTKIIHEGLEIGRKLGNHFLQHDSNVERALRFQREINKCLAQYEEEYKEISKNKKQMLMTNFVSKTLPPENDSSSCETHTVMSDDSEILPPQINKTLFVESSDESI